MRVWWHGKNNPDNESSPNAWSTIHTSSASIHRSGVVGYHVPYATRQSCRFRESGARWIRQTNHPTPAHTHNLFIGQRVLAVDVLLKMTHMKDSVCTATQLRRECVSRNQKIIFMESSQHESEMSPTRQCRYQACRCFVHYVHTRMPRCARACTENRLYAQRKFRISECSPRSVQTSVYLTLRTV